MIPIFQGLRILFTCRRLVVILGDDDHDRGIASRAQDPARREGGGGLARAATAKARAVFYGNISKKTILMPKPKGQKNSKPYGVGPPAKPGYQYRARPATLTTRPRSDGRGTRHPISVRIDDDLGLTVLNAHGRRIDARTRVAKAAKEVLHNLVTELGGPDQISYRQRLQLEVVVRRVLAGRGMFADSLNKDNEIDPAVPVINDRLLIAALDRVYR